MRPRPSARHSASGSPRPSRSSGTPSRDSTCRGRRVSVVCDAREPDRPRKLGVAHVEAQRLQFPAVTVGERAGDANHDAETRAQRIGQRVPTGGTERLPGALVEDHDVEFAQRIGAERGGGSQHPHARAQRELALQLHAGVERPAAQVLELRARRARQHPHAQGRARHREQRHLDVLDHGLRGVADAQAELRPPRRARVRLQREAPVVPGR